MTKNPMTTTPTRRQTATVSPMRRLAGIGDPETVGHANQTAAAITRRAAYFHPMFGPMSLDGPCIPITLTDTHGKKIVMTAMASPAYISPTVTEIFAAISLTIARLSAAD